MMRNSSYSCLQPQIGALELGPDRRRRVVVGREQAENGGAAGVELGSMILTVGVVAALHLAVKRTKE